jgi:cytosine/uracil/thiamine/allantoin permease
MVRTATGAEIACCLLLLILSEVDMSGRATQAPPVLVITGAHPKLYNHDLAPAAPEARTWGVFSLFAMWMSDVHSVGGYTFAASLFFLGLTGWQVLISMVVGIMAVYFLMNLIGRPSQRYGIPYPVVARISFGVMGANLAAVVRGVVGIVWYGVQTYFASKAVQVLVVTMVPSAATWTHGNLLGLSPLAWFSFLFMWFFQLVIFLNGMEVHRFLRSGRLCGDVGPGNLDVVAGRIFQPVASAQGRPGQRRRDRRADGERRNPDSRLF